MERVSRIWFAPQQKAELWERWKSGQCISSIARTLGRRNKSGVYRILALIRYRSKADSSLRAS
ncbi:hypothetical protein FHS84_002479 [Rhizomicrobium electricum]|jgi:hypothetical protein|nr:hypothetical protein [Rhizomicrobium electricum]